MHIVQPIPELNQGGVEVVALNLNREYVKRGIYPRWFPMEG
jgi:hypothetical protein